MSALEKSEFSPDEEVALAMEFPAAARGEAGEHGEH